MYTGRGQRKPYSQLSAIQLGVSLEIHSVADDVSLASAGYGPAEPFAADGSGAPATGCNWR